MSRISRLHPLVCCLALISLPLVSGTGCKTKEQAALERVAQRKKPGFVRLLNLSDKSARVLDSGRVVGLARARSNTIPTTISAGKRTVVAELGTPSEQAALKVKPADLVVETGKVYTVVVWPDYTMSAIEEGQPRIPETVDNAFVLFAGRDGVKSTGTAKVTDPAGKVIEVVAGKPFTVVDGVYKSSDGSATIQVESKFSYCFLFLEEGGKTKPYFFVNSDERRPVMAGTQ